MAATTSSPASANAQLSHRSLHSFSAQGSFQQHQSMQQQSGFVPEAMPSRPLYRGHSSSSLLPMSQNSYRENLLRRKTPQGTLAAAYDATPVEWTARPTKQILLPVLPSNGQHIQLDHGPRWQSVGTQGNQSWEGTLVLRGADISVGSGCVNPTMWATNANSMSTNDSLDPYVRDFLLQQDQVVPPAADNMYTGACPYGFQPLYNPIAGPTASCEDINGFMSVGHYNGIPRDRNVYGHYGTWGDGSATSSRLPRAPVYQINTPYTPPTQQLDNTNIWQPQIQSGESVSTFSQDIVPLYNLVPPAGTPEAQLQHLQLDSPSHMIYQTRATPHSRDKVLAWAHGVYVELLASIKAQPNGRAQSGDRTRGHNGSTKSGLYPRPPIQPRASEWRTNGFRPQPSLNEQVSTQHGIHGGLSSGKGDKDRFKRMRLTPGREQHHSYIGTSSSHSQPLFSSNAGCSFSRNDGVAIYDGSDNVGDGGSSESWNGSNQYFVKKHLVDCSLHRSSSGVENYDSPTNIPCGNLGYMPDQPSSPTQAAMVALEMLNGFCADSGWTWLDGMLLGGCLAYVRTHSLLSPYLKRY